MALKIKLCRRGRKNSPFYRINVLDSRKATSTSAVDSVGFYNPLNKKENKIDKEKYTEWLKKGAQPTEAVAKLMKKLGQEA
jgi:small subunit ribosomal protein S16